MGKAYLATLLRRQHPVRSNQPGNHWPTTRYPNGFAMLNSVCGHIGGRNASPNAAIGMPGACTRKAAISINIIAKSMGIHPNLVLKMLLMNGKQKNGIPKQ